MWALAKQPKQVCMYINRHEGIIDDGDLPSKVRREQERQALADGTFVAPFLVAKKDCELFIKWKGDAGGLQQIRGEKVWVLPVACMSLLPLSLHLG